LATYTTVGTKDGSTLPVIILCAFPSTISHSLFIPKPKAPLSSTLFFLLRALLKIFVATFFLFSNVVYTSSLVLKPWLVVSMDLPFDAQIDTKRFLPIPRKIDRYLSYYRNPTLAKCEDETHTPKVGDLESSGTPEPLELDNRGQNTSHWGVIYINGKVLKFKCPKWPRMSHLDICSPSYGQKKG